MKKKPIICNIFIYFVFIHMCPVLHWHAHEHHQQIETHIKVYPPEQTVNDHHHSDHHNHSKNHPHKDAHFVGDEDYAVKTKTINHKILIKPLYSFQKTYSDSRVYIYIPRDFPLKLPRAYLPENFPERAPPTNS